MERLRKGEEGGEGYNRWAFINFVWYVIFIKTLSYIVFFGPCDLSAWHRILNTLSISKERSF